MKKLIYLILLIFFHVRLLIAGPVTINSINTFNPTCVNNGSITINATEGAPVIGLLYAIFGPINATSTSGVFSSLPDGNYYVKVYTLANDSAVQDNVLLTTTYVAPVIERVDTMRPYCDADYTSSITGVLQAGTGFGPFQWRLDTITGATVRAFQASTTFNGLPRGSYTLVLEDCANTVSTTIIFPSSGNEFRNGFYGNGFPTAEKIHCDTFMIRFGINHNLIDYKPPYRLRITTPDGTYWYNHSDITFMQELQDVWFVSQKVGGLEYGDDISVCFFNYCNDSISFNRTIAQVEGMTYANQLLCNGNVNITALYNDSRPNLMITGLFAPVRFQLLDASTNNTVFDEITNRTQNEILFEQYGYSSVLGITMNNIQNHATYYFIMEDACGLLFRDTITLNAIQQPLQMAYFITYPNSCFDSVVGGIHIQFTGFNDPTLQVLSGPSTLHSTNPMYTYNDIYVYPKSFSSVTDISGNSYTGLWNVAAGSYQVRVTDICGRVLDTVLVVQESSITGLDHDFTFTPGCGNNNTIHFTLQNSHSSNVTIRRVGGSSVFSAAMWAQITPHSISVPNQPSGTYIVEYYLAGTNASSALNNNPTCKLVSDTLIIPVQSTPQIRSYQVAYCNEHPVIELLPNIGLGVAPFQYQLEDKFGVITPLQNNMFFTVADTGNYIATIVDACNNRSNINVFVDVIDYSLINFSGSYCIGDSARIELVYSPYIRYDVIHPSGIVTHASVIHINPITPTEEGWYSIYKYLHIGDCLDTLSQFYYFDVSTCTLPVELINFEGECEGNHLILKWQTASEFNNAYFEIEQSSDGKEFFTIAQIPSKNGFSTTLQDYSFTLNVNKTDGKYYRLKQADINHAISISKTIQVVCGMNLQDGNVETKVFPNPTHDVLQVRTTNKAHKKVRLYNSLGEILIQEDRQELGWQWNISAFAVGIYYLIINDEKAIKLEKLK